ncbi:unnamed protein product [Polarella glacialis]|uniref:Uncharacterized protein n=1 Tax=Polarella glacialis TaxID=89957 RepID=A0A813LHC3_POLGL|nr:unnamed protein product [Polarella glacialis]
MQTDQLLCLPYPQADCSIQTSDSSSSSSSFEDASMQCPDDETYVVFLPKFHSDDVNANAINVAVKNGIWEPFADGVVCRTDHSDDAHNMFSPCLKDNAHPVYPWRGIAGEDAAGFKKCVDGSGPFQVDGDESQNQDATSDHNELKQKRGPACSASELECPKLSTNQRQRIRKAELRSLRPDA